MSRSFARFDPKGADAKIWRTAENGKKYQLDDETGEILKGNVGQKPKGEPYQSRPLDSTAPDMNRFHELQREQKGNNQKAAHEYFKEKLQGRYVETQIDGESVQVTFTGGNWQELKRDMNRDAVKAELVPHMPDIIKTGTHKKNPVHKERKDKAVAFHEYRKKVETSAGPKEAIVDVVERAGTDIRHSAYSLTREGTRNYEDRQKKTPAMDSGSFPRMSGVPGSSGPVSSGSYPNHASHAASFDANISPQFEVVNLRIEDVTVDEDTIVANVTREFQEWLRRDSEAGLARDAAPRGCGRVRPGCFSGPFAGLNRISTDGEGRTWA